MLACELVETGPNPDYAVIWLHGLGADGYDFVPVVPQLNLPQHTSVRFIFPHAPRLPVTVNGGYVMRAWYDIVTLDFNHEDVDGIRQSQLAVAELIEWQLQQGIPAGHVLLAGFSQGGAIVLYTGLRYPQPLGGIIALSTYLPLAASLQREAEPLNKETPIFMAHGKQDAVVAYPLGKTSYDRLQAMGYNVNWHEYPMPHSLCPEEIQDLGAWLSVRFGGVSTQIR